MTKQIWITIIGMVIVHVAAVFGAYTSVQVRLRAVEIRVDMTESQMREYGDSMEKVSDSLNALAIQMAKQNNRADQ